MLGLLLARSEISNHKEYKQKTSERLVLAGLWDRLENEWVQAASSAKPAHPGHVMQPMNDAANRADSFSDCAAGDFRRKCSSSEYWRRSVAATDLLSGKL